MHTLSSLGVNAQHLRWLSQESEPGDLLARVAAVHRGCYDLLSEQGLLRATASGALAYRTYNSSQAPVTGDWVIAQPLAASTAQIGKVAPRTTFLSRRAAGSTETEQVLVANVDTAFLVCGLDQDWNPRRLERYLTLVRAAGVEPVVVLNKLDQSECLQRQIGEARAIADGAPVVPTSGVRGDGVETLAGFLRPGDTAVLLGSSGAGKSTLTNRLLGHQAQEIRTVRDRDGRGRHTTTARQLLLLPNGAVLIDTPGLREIQLWTGPADIASGFEDLRDLAEGCRFRNCSHKVELGCRVLEALATGALDEARLANYRKLSAEAAYQERRTDRHAALAEKRRWKQIHQAMKHGPKRW